MTSEERREARFRRRTGKRQAARARAIGQADNYDAVFTFGNLYQAYRCCRRGVSWKSSVQRYICQAPLNVYATWERLQKGTYRSPGFFEFDLYERGKKRHIRSTVIGERVVQRCLCDHALVPVLKRQFIHDNGASMRCKGYDFAVRRITQHLREHIRKHGREGYILLFDFSKFFDRISHPLMKGIISRSFRDTRLVGLIHHFIDMFGDVGLGLGSQISQVLALAAANRLDHCCKEMLRIRGYGRYNDDGYLIHESKDYLLRCLNAIQRVCDGLGVTLNRRKTHIFKLSHGFSWLKIRFRVSETGRVIRKVYKRSITKMRQKLKKLAARARAGKMSFQSVYHAFSSWRAYASRFDTWHTIQNMTRLYQQLTEGS